MSNKIFIRARNLRKNMTDPEICLWYKVLANKQTGYKAVRQKIIQGFIVDFYIASLKLIIEVDGESHASSLSYDKKRTQILEKHGMKVLRYWNHDITSNIEGVFEHLMFCIEERKKEIFSLFSLLFLNIL
jgi:very-short-patch-repair endonuclease